MPKDSFTKFTKKSYKHTLRLSNRDRWITVCGLMKHYMTLVLQHEQNTLLLRLVSPGPGMSLRVRVHERPSASPKAKS